METENARVLAWYQQFVQSTKSRRRVKHRDSNLNPVARFTLKDFLGTWYQVATSRSTSLFNSGTGITNVQATYGIDLNATAPGLEEPSPALGAVQKNPVVTVVNTGTGPNGQVFTVKGTSVARDMDVLTCRTVTFPTTNPYGPPKPPGNYWIVYITEDRNTIIIGAPLIVEDCIVHANFGLYILTKKARETYWADGRLVQEINDVCRKYGYTKCWNEPVRTD